MNIIDLRPLLDGVVFPILVAVLAPLLTFFGVAAVNAVAKAAHITVDDKARGVIETAINNGLSLAVAKLQPAADQVAQLHTNNAMISEVAAYVLPKVPDALARLGITPAHLGELIQARIANQARWLVPAPPIPATTT